jgi:divalent metal cation (Fe/Co/Zn/Cd) transporter
MKSLLIGEAATAEQQRGILAAIEETPGVRRLIHMRTLHLGPEELLVAAKVELAGSLDVREVADAIDAAEGRIRAAVPIARVIYLEPDLFSAGEAAEPA